jgi:hypothetical protein
VAGNYVKLFGSILNSSVWCEHAETRLVWITMLLLADGEGRVWGAVPGIARQAGVSVEGARRAIGRLTSPDPESRTPDQQGRRLVAIDGGWQVVNARKYRELQTDGQRKASERSKRYRENLKGRDVTDRDDRDASRPSRTEEEEEEKPEPEPEPEQRTDGAAPSVRGRKRPPMTKATADSIEDLAGQLAKVCPSVPKETWVTRASTIPADGNGSSRSFSDPHRKGLSESWGQAALARLRELWEAQTEPLRS